ncbi:MAG TPA: hypothetical protein VFY65_12245 [Longimicrobium sp.]|nr:hypothetical protein [Longimicrobium sp.]
MYRILLLAATLAVLLSACGDSGPTPQQQQARREAALDACISEALSIHARTRLARLDTLLAESQARGTVSSLVSAPHKFAQVYATYADLRAHETAYRDSAYNASSKEDSTRYEGMAASFRVNRPSPESLEENVIRDYQRDYIGSRRNPDHGCNALVEALEKGGDD